MVKAHACACAPNLVSTRQANTKSVEVLFVEFLHFLSFTLDFDGHCVCIREGALKAADKDQFKHKHLPQLCIEDPFDRADNVARSLTEASAKRVRLEFLRAFEVMRHTGDLTRLCQACVRVTSPPANKDTAALAAAAQAAVNSHSTHAPGPVGARGGRVGAGGPGRGGGGGGLGRQVGKDDGMHARVGGIGQHGVVGAGGMLAGGGPAGKQVVRHVRSGGPVGGGFGGFSNAEGDTRSVQLSAGQQVR
jgi:hypothetical protein